MNGVETLNTGIININGNEIKVINYNGTEVWKKYNPCVSATLSLALPAQSNLMTWGYFRGDQFYASPDYGLNISELSASLDANAKIHVTQIPTATSSILGGIILEYDSTTNTLNIRTS